MRNSKLKNLQRAVLLLFGILHFAFCIFNCAAQTTPVQFPVSTLFGGAAYNKPLTITAVNTLITDGQNIWAGTYTILPASTNTITTTLYPNDYLLTIPGVVKPARFSIYASDGTNTVNVVNRLTSGPLFYFGTNGMANLIASTNITFTTNADGSIEISSSGGGTNATSGAPLRGANGILVTNVSGTNVAQLDPSYGVVTNGGKNYVLKNASGTTSLDLSVPDGAFYGTVFGNGFYQTNGRAIALNNTGSLPGQVLTATWLGVTWSNLPSSSDPNALTNNDTRNVVFAGTLTANGNATISGSVTASNLTASGTVNAASFVGNGAGLTNVTSGSGGNVYSNTATLFKSISFPSNAATMTPISITTPATNPFSVTAIADQVASTGNNGGFGDIHPHNQLTVWNYNSTGNTNEPGMGETMETTWQNYDNYSQTEWYMFYGFPYTPAGTNFSFRPIAFNFVRNESDSSYYDVNFNLLADEISFLNPRRSGGQAPIAISTSPSAVAASMDVYGIITTHSNGLSLGGIGTRGGTIGASDLNNNTNIIMRIDSNGAHLYAAAGHPLLLLDQFSSVSILPRVDFTIMPTFPNTQMSLSGGIWDSGSNYLSGVTVHSNALRMVQAQKITFGSSGDGSLYQSISGDGSQNDMTYSTYQNHIFKTDTSGAGGGTTRMTITGSSGLVSIAGALSVAGGIYYTNNAASGYVFPWVTNGVVTWTTNHP